MKRSYLALALVVAALTLVGRAEAQPIAWCADESGQRSRTCAFFTFEQCLAFVHGAGGYCVPNPYLAYAPPPPDGRAPPKRPRRHYDR
jgi:hypothetical protein